MLQDLSQPSHRLKLSDHIQAKKVAVDPDLRMLIKVGYYLKLYAAQLHASSFLLYLSAPQLHSRPQ